MKTIVNLFAIFFLVSCGGKPNSTVQTTASHTNVKQKVSVSIKGSDTVLPLAQMEAEEYLKEHQEAEITVTGGGSGVGITSLKDGTTDIAMSSRALKAEEKIDYKKKGIVSKEVIIANDALAVIVNSGNKVDKLTREQLEKIFTGDITNWKKVGGADMKIVVYARESSSGTYDFFKEHVMDKKNYATSVLNMPATGAIVESVAKTKGAIGYVGLAYETKEVKPIAVSYDQGKTYVIPSIMAAQEGTYPIARPLYFYYDNSKESKVKPFVDYILSEKGQQIVNAVGYVPLKK